MNYSYYVTAHFDNSELTKATNDIYDAIGTAVTILTNDENIAVEITDGYTGELLMYRETDGEYYFTDEMRLMFAGYLRAY